MAGETASRQFMVNGLFSGEPTFANYSATRHPGRFPKEVRSALGIKAGKYTVVDFGSEPLRQTEGVTLSEGIFALNAEHAINRALKTNHRV